MHVHVHAAPSGSAPLDDADAKRRATVVSTFHGGEITIGELEDAIGVASPGTLEETSRLGHVEHWYYQTLRQELLLGEAQRRGYGELPAVRRRVDELALDMMLGAVIAEPIKNFTPTEEALQAFFKTRAAELGAPELRRVVELVVATEAEARALLPAFQAAEGQAQADLIKKSSLARSRDEDGYSRYFDVAGVLDDKSTSVDPALAKATYALPSIGSTSDVFALNGPEKRFAIVKLIALRPAYVPSYEQAVPVMKKLLTDEQRDRERAKLEADARARFTPKVHEELLKLLPTELGSAEADAK